MDEAAHSARGGGGEHRQRALDIPLLERGGIPRADYPGDVDDGVGIVDEAFERGAIVEVAGDPRDALTRRLLPAGEGSDVVAGGDGGIDEVRSDEPRPARDRQPHSGDQGLSLAVSALSTLSAALPRSGGRGCR